MSEKCKVVDRPSPGRKWRRRESKFQFDLIDGIFLMIAVVIVIFGLSTIFWVENDLICLPIIFLAFIPVFIALDRAEERSRVACQKQELSKKGKERKKRQLEKFKR